MHRGQVRAQRTVESKESTEDRCEHRGQLRAKRTQRTGVSTENSGEQRGHRTVAVSYTHLTLPTKVNV